MSIDRYLSIRVRRWRTDLKMSSKKAAIVSSTIIFIFFWVNFTLIFSPSLTTVTSMEGNITINTTTCDDGPLIVPWTQVGVFIF